MPLFPDWTDMGLRIVLTLVAGFRIGINREREGMQPGFGQQYLSD